LEEFANEEPWNLEPGMPGTLEPGNFGTLEPGNFGTWNLGTLRILTLNG